MQFLHYVWLYLWVAPHTLLAVIAVVMLRKGLHKRFPIFFAYLVFEFLQFCFFFAWHFRAPSPVLYMQADELGRAGSIAFRFGILQEIFEASLTPAVQLRRSMAPFLNWATGFFLVLSLLFVGVLDYKILGVWGLRTYFTIESLNAAQCGLIALIFLWYQFLGLKMPPFVFGITMGFGLITSTEPFLQALKASMASQFSRGLDFPQMGIYHACVLFWLYYALVREQPALGDKGTAIPQWIEQGAKVGRIVQL